MEIVYGLASLVEESEDFFFLEEFSPMQVCIQITVFCIVQDQVDSAVILDVIVEFYDTGVIEFPVDVNFCFDVIYFIC